MSIRLKVLMTMLSAFLVVTLFLAMFMYGNYNDIVIRQIKGDISSAMLKNKESIDNMVKSINMGFISIGNNEFIIDAITNETDQHNENYKKRILVADEVKNIFDLVLDSGISRYSLHFYINSEYSITNTLNNRNLSHFYNDAFGLYSTYGVSEKEWFMETLAKKKQLYVFCSEERPGYIYVAKMITADAMADSSGREFLGVGVVGINCEQMLREMTTMTDGENKSIAILDKDNNLICKSDNSIDKDFIADIAKNNSVEFGTTNQIETDEYVITMTKTDASVTFISFVSKKSIFLQARDVRNIAIIAIVAAILLAAVLIFILSYYLTHPIKKLSLAMSKINYDNLVFSRVHSDSKDEVGELYRSFNTMLDKIEASVARENEQNAKAIQMEIKMLQAQINPHFLYNVLDSISWIAMENGQDRIVEMADLLSQIFLYSIKDGKIMASIREELENVKKYVTLQKNRYSDEIRLEIDAEEVCLPLLVPKCILQPLVENSIMHGINPGEDGIIIKISVRKTDAGIEIIIDDNGKGNDMEKINTILKGSDDELVKYHLGIRNVVARIKQLYGNGYGLSYSEKTDGGLIARMLFPETTDENKNERNW